MISDKTASQPGAQEYPLGEGGLNGANRQHAIDTTVPARSEGTRNRRTSIGDDHKRCDEQSARPAAAAAKRLRPRAQGKFLFIGETKLYLRGVTYGPFRPDTQGNAYRPEIAEADFERIAACGFNAIRTYDVPPRWMLDTALRHGIWVMVGLPGEQYAAFLDEKKIAQAAENLIREGPRACAGHPAVFCYAIANEIQAPMVRWYGAKHIKRYLRRLFCAVKSEDPDALVTYVNYPTTEYLELPFVDFLCFNVYLESQEAFDAYLRRLQNIAGDRPLVMGEIGLDSRRNGENAQADALDRQIRTSFAGGCAGAFVYAWTDQWHSGGHDMEDWDFGLTRRDRSPKPALEAARRAMAAAPFPAETPWPRISVVVCSFNGAGTIRECLEGLSRLDYPNFEVIVVNDGSTDRTADIAREYSFRVITMENRGLSNARNTGLKAATGEIVAYIDDDAHPDPQWLKYLAATFLKTKHAAVGGPNIAPSQDGSVATAIASAPGGPMHVLVSDDEAEHIPGCNMAFRKAHLEAIDGFDAQFRSAGDDVDLCWRLQQRGWTLGFSPAAMVWHQRRNSVLAFWKQQVGYGKAEAMLERKWPEKYNGMGNCMWGGRIYGLRQTYLLGTRTRIYHGTWGSAPFQSLYQPAPNHFWTLPMMPEWYLLIGALALISALGFLQRSLLFATPLLAIAVLASLVQAGLRAAHTPFEHFSRSRLVSLKLRGILALLNVLQPLARLYGHLGYRLTPWRRRGVSGFRFPFPRRFLFWTESWQPATRRLESLEAALRANGGVVVRGGGYDRWDLELRGGLLGSVRASMAVEERGGGTQLLRLRVWPNCWSATLLLILLLAAIAWGQAIDQAWTACAMVGAAALILGLKMLNECGAAMATLIDAINQVLRPGA